MYHVAAVEAPRKRVPADSFPSLIPPIPMSLITSPAINHVLPLLAKDTLTPFLGPPCNGLKTYFLRLGSEDCPGSR